MYRNAVKKEINEHAHKCWAMLVNAEKMRYYAQQEKQYNRSRAQKLWNLAKDQVQGALDAAYTIDGIEFVKHLENEFLVNWEPV